MAEKNRLLEAALRYAARGWPVFPCHTPGKRGCSCGKIDCPNAGKHPRYHKDDLQHGVKDATVEPALIRSWWARWPQANIGGAAGICWDALDVDIKPDFSGLETLADLQLGAAPLPATLSQVTGGGGRQYFFRPSEAIQNAVGFAKGLDTRAAGGYVILPPSLHKSGKRYRWADGPMEIAEWPQWLVEKISTARSALSVQRAGVDSSEVLAGIPEGERDQRLYSYACSLRAKNLGRAEAEILVLEAASRCRPPFPADLARKKLEQAWKHPPGSPLPQKAVSSSDAEPKRTLDGDPKGALPRFNFTELGLAEYLAWFSAGNVRYCHPWAAWYCWDRTRWKEDDTGEIDRIVKDGIRHLYKAAADESDDERRKGLIRLAMKSESDSRIRAATRLLRSEPRIPVVPADFDSDPWALNCPNGTLNLRNGNLRPHERADRITKLCGSPYLKDAEAPIFQSALDRWMAGNDRMKAFLARYAGYSLTGSIAEQVFAIFHGWGGNGKSKYLGALRMALGDYCRTADVSTFLLAKSNTEAKYDLARLQGARLVTASESEADRKLAEALVKKITGDDPVSCRHLYQEGFEYTPTWKLVISVNHRPAIWGSDMAIWRRIMLIPWEVTIPPAERDRYLGDKLAEELPGVLAWMIRGCIDWQERGLDPPTEVLEATERYREEMDALAEFLSSCCVKDESAQVTAKLLYEAYETWCQESAEKPFTKRTFGTKLGERGFSPRKGGGGRRIWSGLRLLGENEAPEQSDFGFQKVAPLAPQNSKSVEKVAQVAPPVADCAAPQSESPGESSEKVAQEGSVSITSLSISSHRELIETSATCAIAPHFCQECPALGRDGFGKPVSCFGKTLFRGESGKAEKLPPDFKSPCPYEKERDDYD